MGWKALALVVALTGCNLETKTPAGQLAEVKTWEDCYLIYAAKASTTYAVKTARFACDSKFGRDVALAVHDALGKPGQDKNYYWIDVLSAEKWKTAEDLKRSTIKNHYFANFIEPNLSPEKRDEAYAYFLTRSDQMEAALNAHRPKEKNAIDRFGGTATETK